MPSSFQKFGRFFVSPKLSGSMLKKILCRLPQLKQLNTGEKIKFLFQRLALALIQKQFQNKKPLHLVFKVFTILLFFTSFLFVTPLTKVQANFAERVIDVQGKAVIKISDSISFEKIPTFQAPLYNSYITSLFSNYHQGIDIPNPTGALVTPVADGEVTYAAWSNLGYGNLVIIHHNGGYDSLYAHLSEINVKVGDKLTLNSVIGKVGATGRATGSHLHLEIHLRGLPINPLSLLSPLKNS